MVIDIHPVGADLAIRDAADYHGCTREDILYVLGRRGWVSVSNLVMLYRKEDRFSVESFGLGETSTYRYVHLNGGPYHVYVDGQKVGEFPRLHLASALVDRLTSVDGPRFVYSVDSSTGKQVSCWCSIGPGKWSSVRRRK